ncbi:hypothetical protein ABZ863_25205 [Saccharomonospora sp. NPDC046836]|uniref:hypothetical protein n=1 Tax=Saccharomonospora sp. NPDC046836 TaxID=3156921 RepID=UPI0033DC9A72
MDVTAPRAGPEAQPAAPPTNARAWVPAALVLTGTVVSLIGLSWDAQWHADVGPDTFFTLPHLFLYSGSAMSGLASLAVVLATTAARRSGKLIDPAVGGRSVGVFGKTFTAPLGYLVSGTGAALFLLYGLWDQWWHTLYGFDAVLESPPHIGLMLSITVTMVGSVMVFAAAKRYRWSTPGLVLSTVVLLSFNVVTVLGLQMLNGVVNAFLAGMAFMVVLIWFVLGGFTRRGGALLAAAVGLTVSQVLLWWFSPWAARVYADMVNLPLRDYVDGVPAVPALIPMSVIPVAALVEAILWAGRKGMLSTKVATAVAGVVGGMLTATLFPLQLKLVYGGPLPGAAELLATGVVAAGLGLLAALTGRRFGALLSRLSPEARWQQA